MDWQKFWQYLGNAFKANNQSLDAVFNGDYSSDDGWLDQVISGQAYKDGYQDQEDRVNSILNGMGSAIDKESQIVNSGLSMSSDQEKLLNNMLSTDAANDARNFEEHMRDTDLTSSGAQLQSLGISPSTLAGSTASHSGVGQAHLDTSNVAQQKYERKLGVAQSLIHMASAMATSGIYGASLYGVKKFAANAALNAAHSGKDVIRYYNRKGDFVGGYTKANEWNLTPGIGY